MKIIFQIDGGIGKSVAATAVCRAIKTQYPNDELIVITGYPEVFLCNPYIERVFNFNNLNYFYQDHIAGHKIKMMSHNPYVETNFVAGEGHLIQVWCAMFGIAYNGEKPELYINADEMEHYAGVYNSPKPLMVLQTNGGAANQPNKYSWMRDLPLATAQQVVNAFADEYNIAHIRREDQPALHGVKPVHAEFRAIAALIALSSKRLFIDSFCQHAAAAVGRPSVVCWVGNKPEQFGYGLHANVLAAEPTVRPELRHSVFSKYNISGTPTEFPYRHQGELFNAEQIIAILRGEYANVGNVENVANVGNVENVENVGEQYANVQMKNVQADGVAEPANVAVPELELEADGYASSTPASQNGNADKKGGQQRGRR